ncbi:MAG: phenylacetate--CoA ligase family protein [Nitrosomonadales bacterium]|nr:phenylacetate--CoA ligase family protein [Nitrosomonadales bacterium]
MLRDRFAKTWLDRVQVAKGWDYRPALAALEQSQWLPREQVEQQNLLRLRELLTHCQARVPFYRDAMKQCGFEPDDLRSLADIGALPIISKADLRAGYDRFRATGEKSPYDVWNSSGSTGEPFFFRLDRRSISANTYAALARGRRWWGMDYGVREGMIWSGLSDLTGTARGRLAALKRRISWSLKNITAVDVYLLDDAAIVRGYQAFLRSHPRVLRAIASGLLRFCAGLERLGLDGRKLGIEAAIYTGEGLTRAQRDRIESVLGCPTVTEYGCTELGIIAFECPEGGLHVSHDNLLVEYLVGSRQAEVGEQAEMVITNLNEWVHPLVRYKIGDFAAPSAQTCACGRTLPLIGELGGRVHDSIRTPQGQVIHGLYFTHLFDRLPEVAQFRVIQRQLDRFAIEIVVPEISAERAKRSIETAVRDTLGETMAVEVRTVASLPVAASGKTRWIVSELDE